MVDITSSQDIQEPVEIEQEINQEKETLYILEEQQRGSTHFLHFKTSTQLYRLIQLYRNYPVRAHKSNASSIL